MTVTRRRAASIFACIVGLLAIVAVATPDKLKIAGLDTPGSESRRSTARLHAVLGYDPEPGMVVLARSRAGFSSPGPRAALAAVASRIRADRGVGRVQTPFGPGGSRVLLSSNRRAALVLVHFKEVSEEGAKPAIDRLRDIRSPQLSLELGGFDVGFIDDNKVVREDLLRAELIAFPLLALLLIWVFRGAAAARLPLVIGGLSVLGTFAGLRLLSHVMDVSVFALNLSAALGLGLAVDYGLFLVSRYREECAARGPGPEAVDATMATAGRAVLYSSATVAGACCALLLFPQQFIYSMGLGALLTSVLSAAAALIVVPALLPRWGGSGRRLTPRDAGDGGWFRFSHWVMKRAVVVAVVSGLVILAAGIPALRLTPTFLDYRALPAGLESREVANDIAAEFVPFLEYPISLAVGREAAASPGELDDLSRQIASMPGAGLVSPAVRARDGTALIQVIPRYEPLSDRSQELVRQIRRLDAPVLAGGRVADFVDLKASIRDHAPLALALVTLATLLVVFLLTDSVVLPVKALLMNSLTLFAVFGVMVVLFQDRFLDLVGLFGYAGPAAIETTISVVVIGVTLGLATDYSILLISRIKEEHDAGRSNEDAVAVGLERSGRVITSAALLLGAALLAGVSSRVFLVQQLVVGLAVGVAIDASIVRACLVPSLMKILGGVNWWAPGWLHALHARLGAGPAALSRLRADKPGAAAARSDKGP